MECGAHSTWQPEPRSCKCNAGWSGKDEFEIYSDCHINENLLFGLYALDAVCLFLMFARSVYAANIAYEVGPDRGIRNAWNIKLFHFFQMLYSLCGTIRLIMGCFGFRRSGHNGLASLLLAMSLSAWLSCLALVPSLWWNALKMQLANYVPQITPPAPTPKHSESALTALLPRTPGTTMEIIMFGRKHRKDGGDDPSCCDADTCCMCLPRGWELPTVVATCVVWVAMLVNELYPSINSKYARTSTVILVVTILVMGISTLLMSAFSRLLVYRTVKELMNQKQNAERAKRKKMKEEEGKKKEEEERGEEGEEEKIIKIKNETHNDEEEDDDEDEEEGEEGGGGGGGERRKKNHPQPSYGVRSISIPNTHLLQRNEDDPINIHDNNNNHNHNRDEKINGVSNNNNNNNNQQHQPSSSPLLSIVVDDENNDNKNHEEKEKEKGKGKGKGKELGVVSSYSLASSSSIRSESNNNNNNMISVNTNNSISSKSGRRKSGKSKSKSKSKSKDKSTSKSRSRGGGRSGRSRSLGLSPAEISIRRILQHIWVTTWLVTVVGVCGLALLACMPTLPWLRSNTYISSFFVVLASIVCSAMSSMTFRPRGGPKPVPEAHEASITEKASSRNRAATLSDLRP